MFLLLNFYFQKDTNQFAENYNTDITLLDYIIVKIFHILSWVRLSRFWYTHTMGCHDENCHNNHHHHHHQQHHHHDHRNQFPVVECQKYF